LKKKVGLAAAKAAALRINFKVAALRINFKMAALRINFNLDGCGVVAPPTFLEKL
jgi:hypothetical protein